MEREIILLISDDIKISTLINTLENLNVSAYSYHLNNSKVIFNLMGIPIEDEVQELYYNLIELGADIVKYNLPLHREEVAKEIYKSLKTIKKFNDYVQ